MLRFRERAPLPPTAPPGSGCCATNQKPAHHRTPASAGECHSRPPMVEKGAGPGRCAAPASRWSWAAGGAAERPPACTARRAVAHGTPGSVVRSPASCRSRARLVPPAAHVTRSGGPSPWQRHARRPGERPRPGPRGPRRAAGQRGAALARHRGKDRLRRRGVTRGFIQGLQAGARCCRRPQPHRSWPPTHPQWRRCSAVLAVGAGELHLPALGMGSRSPGSVCSGQCASQGLSGAAPLGDTHSVAATKAVTRR